jgi:hypothetical protein
MIENRGIARDTASTADRGGKVRRSDAETPLADLVRFDLNNDADL